jgi:hypothetical protein
MKAKIRRLQISQEFFPLLFRENTAWRMYKGLPADTVMKGWTIDPHTNVLTLFVSHPSFKEVNIYNVCPEMELEFIAIK